MNRVYAVRETILHNDRETAVLSPLYATRELAEVRWRKEKEAHKNCGSVSHFYDVISFPVRS